MRISLIAAVANNNVIGNEGALPWHLPEDLKRFKRLTLGKPVVMGRLTHESIGRPLPGRQNIVLTRQPHYVAGGCEVVRSVEAALDAAEGADEVMIIGGGEIYALFLPLAGRIYLTRVDTSVAGDAYFPELEAVHWREVEAERAAAAETGCGVDYVVLERRDPPLSKTPG